MIWDIVTTSKGASAEINYRHQCTGYAIIARGQFAAPLAAEDNVVTIDRDKAAASCHRSHPRLQLLWRQWDPQCRHGYPNQSTKTLVLKVSQS
jgi:hypothetical protein